MDKINLSKKLLKIVGRTNAKYNLIKEGDRVLLGLSGGKDSLNLAHILQRQSKIAPFKFEFKALTISYGMNEDLEKLKEHCKIYDINYEIKDTNIFSIAKDKIRENSSYCSFFSRMRRGYLYSYALENGYNKVALGHHFDDAVESFFMNFLYNGVLRSMPPKYKAKNGLVVIRPLIMCRERQLRDSALKNDLPVIGDESCPSLRFDVKLPYARENTKKLLQEIERDNPKVFVSLMAAFKNIHLNTFLVEDKLKEIE